MSHLTGSDIKILSEPFDAKTICVKVNNFSKDKTKAMLVCYLQHTDVYQRLEQVDPAWSCETVEVAGNGPVSVRMKMTVKGVVRENVGEGEDPKSAYSDAIKRCAMLFGVGRYLYDAENVWVEYNDAKDRFRTWTLADYSAALKRGQAQLPTSEAPKAATNSTSLAGNPTSKARTKAQISSDIIKTAKALNLPVNEMADWIQHDFKKPMDKLSEQEMEEFLGTLQLELKGKGA